MKTMGKALLLQIIALLLLAGNIWLSYTTLWKYPLMFLMVITSALFIGAFIFNRQGYAAQKGIKKFVSWCIGAFSVTMVSGLVLFSAAFLSTVLLFGGVEKLETVTAPDDLYRVTFYRFDAGAMGTFGVRGELHGPLGFRKAIYYEQHATDVTVQWPQPGVIRINNVELDLTNAEVQGYRIKGQ